MKLITLCANFKIKQKKPKKILTSWITRARIHDLNEPPFMLLVPGKYKQEVFKDAKTN